MKKSYSNMAEINAIIANSRHSKNALFVCTETDQLYTLADVIAEWLECRTDENEPFEDYLDGALDFSGSLRQVLSVRHYLYLINFTVEKEIPLSDREQMYRDLCEYDMGYRSDCDYEYYSMPFEESTAYGQIA